MNNEIPGIHLFIYSELKKKTDFHRNFVLKTCDIMDLHRQFFYRIPRCVFYVTLEEMEKYKLIVKIDRLKYKIIPSNKDSQLKKYYDKYLWSNGS